MGCVLLDNVSETEEASEMKQTKIPLGSVTKYKVFTGQVIHMFFVFAPYGKMSFFFFLDGSIQCSD